MAKKLRDPKFPCPSHTVEVRSEDLELQDSGLQTDRNISGGPQE